MGWRYGGGGCVADECCAEFGVRFAAAELYQPAASTDNHTTQQWWWDQSRAVGVHARIAAEWSSLIRKHSMRLVGAETGWLDGVGWGAGGELIRLH